MRSALSAVLFNCVVSTLWAHFGHHHLGLASASREDNRSCYDPHVNLDVVGGKYELNHWPRFEEIEKCIRGLDPVTRSKHLVPHPCAGRVRVSLKLVDLQDINVAENLISMKITYLEQWKDPRIILPVLMNTQCGTNGTLRSMMYLEPPEFYRTRLWTPDFYIKAVVRAKSLKFIKRYQALILHRTRAIQNIVTLNVDMMCDMNFEHYPFDTQICNVTIESFGTFYDRIAILWHSGGVELLPEFSLAGYEVDVMPQKPTAVRYAGYTFPRVTVTLSFRRIRMKYILLIYIPSLLHFLIAWLAFFLPKEVSQGRCIINCSTTLSLVSMLSVYTRNSPHGGYVKALDVWCYFSVFFQFLCTLDAMIDTRLLYAASNIKRNPVEAGTRHVWDLVTDASNWLGKEVRLVRTQDEGKGFDETLRDMRRLHREYRLAMAESSQETKLKPGFKRQNIIQSNYRFSPRYYRFLKLLVMYQEWSQYLCLAWYLIFLLGYWVLYVP
ncbi:ligand-gated ion channel 50-like [Pollicipes pollicipes]|uniref:ligand-gated ion channel 50-like n=1 Tax=Pollicipes pollicipes TaxID=41117 RepID=UPI001884C61C|nr:ligand-gated ion channel 50-like [Pollicipes pollicipes]